MEPDDDLVITFVPALVAILLAAERAKGSPLTEAEVLETRGSAACIVLPRSVVDAMADKRGYDDLEPERCWEQWRSVRTELTD